MLRRIITSFGVVCCAAVTGAWVQDGEVLPDYLCKAVTVCADYEGVATPCAVRTYDLDGDGVCEETCEKCVPWGNNNQLVYTCERFEEVDCLVLWQGGRCDGFLVVSPCLNGVCANLWMPTTDPCSFGVPDCR